MLKKIILFLICISSLAAAEESIRITGVDTSAILINGTVDVYVSLQGEGVDELGTMGAEDFKLSEFSSSAGIWKEAEINRFQYNGYSQDEISIMLLLDNSGSMYDSLNGTPEKDSEKRRISILISALSDLLEKTEEYKDNLSIMTFNTDIKKEYDFTYDRTVLAQSLNNIHKPDTDHSYTELYRAMQQGMKELSIRKGRKVLILLTDGENYTYAENKKEPHPLYGNNLVNPGELQESLLKSGITLYTIYYARQPDAELSSLTERTGGKGFDAFSEEDLTDAYLEIHDSINKEFRLTYVPAVSLEREKILKVTDGNRESQEFAYLWEIFWGLPPNLPWWVFTILTAFSVLIILVIHKTPFERLYPYSHLEVLSPQDGNSTILELAENKTLIAVSSGKTEIIHDGNFQNIQDNQTGITIVKDADDSFTLISDTEVLVNNNPVKEKKLKPGDVIRSDGTLIVFDEPGK